MDNVVLPELRNIKEYVVIANTIAMMGIETIPVMRSLSFSVIFFNLLIYWGGGLLRKSFCFHRRCSKSNTSNHYACSLPTTGFLKQRINVNNPIDNPANCRRNYVPRQKNQSSPMRISIICLLNPTFS